MRIDEFINNFCDLVQTEKELKPETPLEEIEEWDSMAMMAFIAYMDVEHGQTISFGELEKKHSVGDLARLIPNMEPQVS